jgi:methylated-DNA-[protein]-cysteine S-methyltransferase
MSAGRELVSHVGDSALGWIAVLASPSGVARVTFGHPSRAAARKSLAEHLPPEAAVEDDDGAKDDALLARLQDFAAGEFDDFWDVELDFSGYTYFQRRVLELCRRIPYGETLSYGELAERAGNPGAARAVGSTMAANRWPLVVPCHRVVQAGGRLGNYSAPQGVSMKRRLLDLEAATVLV